MNVVLFDDELAWKNLLPLTFTRPISEIRIGILTIAQKWEKCLNTKVSYQTQTYLLDKFKCITSTNNLFINATICPDENLLAAINQLPNDCALVNEKKLLAYKSASYLGSNNIKLNTVNYTQSLLEINVITDIFTKNDSAIKSDFSLLTKNKVSQPIHKSVTVIGDENLVFLEPGAKAYACIFNTNSGPVYLGEDSEVMEGSVVRGPLALCEHSVLKLSTKIYGATTVGPHSKVGGELNNSVIFGYSNKAHDGFLGNSIIGEWCNLGADTNNSNLKNNYGNVKLYNYHQNKAIDSGLQFCGLIMGDYSKSGINTMFNTGTVVGVACNIFGADFPPTHIPSFSWGGAQGFENYQLEKLFETTAIIYQRRNLIFDENDKAILKYIYPNIKES